jgi:uncharacterized protein (TIGR03437 family)
MRFLLLLATAAPILAQTCSYTANRLSFTEGAASVSENIVVTTQKICSWTAVASDSSWIQIPNGPNYTGTATVTFTLTANASTQYRTGTITVGYPGIQQVVSITQLAGTCTYQIAPPLSASVPVNGMSGNFQVDSGCSWTVRPNTSWITISSPTASVLGNGTVSYTAAANGCVASRSGTVIVNTGAASPPTFTITEDGSPNNLTLIPPTAAFGAAATVGRVTVNTGAGCPWSASPSDASWLQITPGSGAGSGGGAINYTILQNLGPPRVGHFTVGPQLFTVTQDTSGPAAPLLSAISNSASGATGAVSPGEIVSLFGANLGPATGVAFGQTITNTLGGVQVMFGSTPAPLTFVSASQINAIVPYGVAGSGSTQIQVQYQGQSSNTWSATVQTATPGIFSADHTGQGPGAILNGDYTLNSGTNPAHIGSAVMIYGTGGGVTSPASADGSFAPSAEPFPQLLLPVTVTIGGVPAQAFYSGGAPGLVAGLTQFNVIVPAGVTPGPAVPVLLQVGGFSSQANLTMAVQ